MKLTLPEKNRDGGFTLVEVLSAVLLLSIGLLAILTATNAVRETQHRATNLAKGRTIAQSKIEELRSAPIEAAATASSVSSSSLLPDGNEVRVQVTPYPGITETNLILATVSVSWPEGNGRRTIHNETLISRK